jgi:hypothetical protein
MNSNWYKTAMKVEDIKENVRFYDPWWGKGKLVTRTYHRTTLWMMLYDDGTITELTNGDLRRIELLEDESES